MRPRRGIVIVGASLAGLRTAQALRAGGFAGPLTLIGDEPHLPYDRPPLSKRQLTSAAGPAETDLPVPDGLDADWVLGTPAVRLEPDRRLVRLADGREFGYDGLVIATGVAARGLPGHRGPLPAGVFTLRTRDDAVALRAELRPGRGITVVGGGFLGSEIAATARDRGLDTTLVVPAARPLERLVGAAAGGYVAELHRAAGITLATGRTVTALDERSPATTLSDGTRLAADLTVLALGSTPNTAWLAGSGAAVDQGVVCDPYLRVLDEDGDPLPGVVAAGDVVDWPHPLVGGRRISLGHWSNAVDQAATAAHTLLHPDGPRPFTAVPTFWSDLHGITLRAVGLPAAADEHRVVELDPTTRKLEITYHRDGRLVGALTVGRNARLAAHRLQLADSIRPAATV